MTRIIDVTVPFRTDLPLWPGSVRPVVKRVRSIAGGEAANVSRLDTGCHYGTHVDAPVHFIDGGDAVEALPLDAMVGPAYVVEIADAKQVTAARLERAAIPSDTQRLLVKTGNSALWDKPNHAFFEDFAALAPDGAQWVVDRGIRLVGVDYLSVQRFRDDPANRTHHVLLGARVVIVEGLDLRAVAPGRYGLTCLPLKLVGSDGAPARVILTAD